MLDPNLESKVQDSRLSRATWMGETRVSMDRSLTNPSGAGSIEPYLPAPLVISQQLRCARLTLLHKLHLRPHISLPIFVNVKLLTVMRLLDARSLQLREFFGNQVPPYAILSHTWGNDEVTFTDVQKGELKPGSNSYAKVQQCCRQAVRDGLSWVWIDTCSIDKSSSAELSEAINSMYAWYQKSTVCYAYLVDLDLHATSPDDFENRFRKSRWFTRGWTLQELIAPLAVKFYDRMWTFIGTKESLVDVLREKTGIRESVLMGGDPPSICSVAERMSWAAERVTTREEDIAYSLLGLFNINMPLLYGEGNRAFFRLQEEILRHEEDYTLIIWAVTDESQDFQAGALARSPADFGKYYTVPYNAKSEGSLLYGIGKFEWSVARSIAPPQLRMREGDKRPVIDLGILAENFDPPTINSRGLRLKLFSKKSLDGSLLLWTFCVNTASEDLIMLKFDSAVSLWRSAGILEHMPKEKFTGFKPKYFDLPVRWKEPPRDSNHPTLRPGYPAQGQTHVLPKVVILGVDTSTGQGPSNRSQMNPGIQEAVIRFTETWPPKVNLHHSEAQIDLLLEDANKVPALSESAQVRAVLGFRYSIGKESDKFALILGSHRSRVWFTVSRETGHYPPTLEEYYLDWQDIELRNIVDTNVLCDRPFQSTRWLGNMRVWITVTAQHNEKETVLHMSVNRKRRRS